MGGNDLHLSILRLFGICFTREGQIVGYKRGQESEVDLNFVISVSRM